MLGGGRSHSSVCCASPSSTAELRPTPPPSRGRLQAPRVPHVSAPLVSPSELTLPRADRWMASGSQSPAQALSLAPASVTVSVLCRCD